MIKRYSPRPRYREPVNAGYRLNQQIPASQLRVIDETGKQIGVMSKFDALRKANEVSLDLVEIAPKANPPVAKIIDFKKFLYQMQKKKRQTKTKTGETKEVWLSPFIGEHDLSMRIEKGKDLLKDGGKLKIVVKFRGRELTKKQFGFEVVKKYIAGLEVAKIDKEPHFEGRSLVAIVVRK